ncbi:MAG: SBBP repeat-containing protein, partial [Anaerolineales bacterium]|nr:SBBP repeat-containing protein [Anaerolineales bacterium]
TANAVQPQKQGIVTMSDAFITRLVRQGSGYQIGFSTYLGGSETEVGNAVGMNAAGQVFVAGYTSSSDFPVADAWQPTFGPGLCFGSTSRNCFDAFIVQFAPTGDMPFSTYWGSLFDDLAKGLALDNNGNVYVVGKTESPGFPTTDGGFQPERGQGDEAFVVKLTTAVSPPPPNLTQQVYLPIVIR